MKVNEDWACQASKWQKKYHESIIEATHKISLLYYISFFISSKLNNSFVWETDHNLNRKISFFAKQICSYWFYWRLVMSYERINVVFHQFHSVAQTKQLYGFRNKCNKANK